MLYGATNAEKIWNYFKSVGMSEYGIAGLIGNLDCESALNPKNLQDSFEAVSGFTDESYTTAVDDGSYKNFVYDNAGYGLFQATWWSRKKALLDYAKECGTSIGDLEMQIRFIHKELKNSYHSVYSTLMSATSIKEASNAVLLKYECPCDTSVKVQEIRFAYAQKYYARFSKNTGTGGVNNMGYINVAKKSGMKLSEHFNSNEFDCHGSGCCSTTIINEKLVEYLEKIREHFKKPITITSAYRCVTHNRNVGGATGSRHSKGDAADIVVSGVSPAEVAKFAESIGIKGIGLYETSADGHFVHIDTRDAKSFWYGQKCAARSTFGGSNASTTVTTPESKNYMLSVGSTGNAVRALQENLVLLGYPIATDGIYGAKTQAAVRDYQSKNGLKVDGIAGTITQKSISDAVSKKNDSAEGYMVHVTASALNIRKGAGTNYAITGMIRDKGIYKIVSESTGSGASKWGKLADGRGWIALDYCTKS